MSGLVAKSRRASRGTRQPGAATRCRRMLGGCGVLPDFRHRGIGSALYDHLERMARDAGRTTIQNQTTFPAGDQGEHPGSHRLRIRARRPRFDPLPSKPRIFCRTVGTPERPFASGPMQESFLHASPRRWPPLLAIRA